MKPCIRCGNLIADDANYCNACNSEQILRFEEFEVKPKPNSTFLIVLCVLTILGCLFTLAMLPFSNQAAVQLGMEYPVYLLVASGIMVVGKLAGAIMMLFRKINSLYIYTATAVGSIFVSIYSSFIIDYPEVSRTLTYISMGIGLMFAAVFIVLYWLPVNRKVLS